MRALDLAVIAAYLVFTLALGLWVSRRQSSAGDYFLGARDLPAWAVMLSVVCKTIFCPAKTSSVDPAGIDVSFKRYTLAFVFGLDPAVSDTRMTSMSVAEL